MTQEEFLHLLKESGHIIGTGSNALGEAFIVYSLSRDTDNFYVTGDKLDWEMAWAWRPKELVKTFAISEDENRQIKNTVLTYLRKAKNE